MSIPKLPVVTSPYQNSILAHKNDVQPITTDAFFKDGRSYMLANSKVSHHLPAPNKLRPYIDRKAGHVDTWPAHATANMEAKTSSKPKFLQNLESYLQKELKILGCSDTVTISEKRLHAFREVFEYLIDDFRTYKPLLSAIKHEYEAVLNAQKEKIRNLEPLKGMLVNINDQCEQKVLNLKQEEKQDLINLRHENTDLQNEILTLKENITSLEQQVKKCQDEIAHEYQKYRDESDSRKLLVQDINDLRYQQEEAKRALTGSIDGDSSKKEDAVVLHIALRKAREDLDLKTQKLAEVMADYGDVVPRRDFEKLEAQFKIMEDEFDTLKKDNETLLKEHSTLIEVHKKVIEQRDGFALDCERMRRSATPRPDWKKCAMYIEGGVERWNAISCEKSTRDKVDILLSEMTGQDISVIKAGGAILDFFEPKGVEEDVPKHLRSSEPIRNRHLSKRDLSIMIKDIWLEKNKTKDDTTKENMAEFFYKYLKQQFGTDTMIVEWGYNVNDALTRYSFDGKIALFSQILNGELDEEIYYEQLNRLEGLYKSLAALDSSDTGILLKNDFQNCLTDYFTNFSSDNVASLMASADEELNGSNDLDVPYRDLFTEDDEGNTGPFIRYIHKLDKQDKEKYLSELEVHLTNKSELDVDGLREALRSIDPNISQDNCERFITFAFRANTESTQAIKLDKQTLLNNLRSNCIRRT